MALFIALVKREGVTVFFTSHNVQHALNFGDRVLGLKGGRMAIDAAAADVSPAEMGRLYA